MMIWRYDDDPTRHWPVLVISFDLTANFCRELGVEHFYTTQLRMAIRHYLEALGIGGDYYKFLENLRCDKHEGYRSYVSKECGDTVSQLLTKWKEELPDYFKRNRLHFGFMRLLELLANWDSLGEKVLPPDGMHEINVRQLIKDHANKYEAVSRRIYKDDEVLDSDWDAMIDCKSDNEYGTTVSLVDAIVGDVLRQNFWRSIQESLPEDIVSSLAKWAHVRIPM